MRVGTVAADTAQDTDYIAQVSQLSAPQLAQGLPPIMEDTPLSSLEKQAKLDNTRSALCWQ